ncbi:hypothetical protein R6242_19550 [Iodobacter sp. CM08]|uniref:hypothetical protein n=1 Tax=Iodobacter sp. CM08 TaxID=3085902 RepID=UPI0029827768|nr:hypothetical protein [Iodobacter sp. CM08]MDW5418768.1 hypothetical protein [Iodobacter sp. CM08]
MDYLLSILRHMLDGIFYVEDRKKGTPLKSSFEFVANKVKEELGAVLTATDFWFVINCIDANVVRRNSDGIYIIIENENMTSQYSPIPMKDRDGAEVSFSVLDHLIRPIANNRRRAKITVGIKFLESEAEILKFANKLKRFQGATISQVAIVNFLKSIDAPSCRIDDIKRLACNRGFYSARSKVRNEQLELTDENAAFLKYYGISVGQPNMSNALNALIVRFRFIIKAPISNATPTSNTR